MTGATHRMELVALAGIPEIRPGDDLAGLIRDAMIRMHITPRNGDILVIAQKIISKAEGLMIDLATVQPTDRARMVAAQVDKDPRLVELILRESREIVAQRPGLLITVHVSGCILANAGIDRSNVSPDGTREWVTLLPRDSDSHARALRGRLDSLCGTEIGIIICDSMGRPWRLGVCGFALGVAGLAAIHDHRGRADRYGRPLAVSTQAVADELSSAAGLLMGQADESCPVVLVRGFQRYSRTGSAKDLLRPAGEDLFR